MSRANAAAYFGDDGQVHTMAARVEAWDGQPSHYEVNEEGDVIVHCKLHQAGTPVKANLGPMCAARGAGVWLIPDVGTEVILASDQGNVEGELYLIAMHPTGRNPGGLAPGKVLVIGDNVEVRSFDGTAQKLANETYRNREDVMLSSFQSAYATLLAMLTPLATLATSLSTSAPPLGSPGQQAATQANAAALAPLATAAATAAGDAEAAIADFEADAAEYLTRVLKGE